MPRTFEGRLFDLTLQPPETTDNRYQLAKYALVEAEDMAEAVRLTKHLGTVVNCSLVRKVVILKGDK